MNQTSESTAECRVFLIKLTTGTVSTEKETNVITGKKTSQTSIKGEPHLSAETYSVNQMNEKRGINTQKYDEYNKENHPDFHVVRNINYFLFALSAIF